MDQLTALRTFGKPGFTPAKHVKVFNDRYYKCTFQKVETDPRTDYVGLAEGEYVQILPGAKAREARDAHLNHLNRLEEWNGPVFEVQRERYDRPSYTGSREEAEALKKKWQDEDARMLEKALAAIDKELGKSDAELTAFYGKCQGWPGHEAEKIAEHREAYKQLRKDNIRFKETPTIKELRLAVAPRGALASRPSGGTSGKKFHRSKLIKRPRLTR